MKKTYHRYSTEWLSVALVIVVISITNEHDAGTQELIVPLLEPLGINKVHFGVLMTVNMEMALITPPVGMNLFVVSKTADIRMTRVVRASIPFLIVNIIVLMLITYVPIISTWLPGLAGFM